MVKYDHTSSGFQILAALAGDSQGAPLVNIAGNGLDHASDLYSQLAFHFELTLRLRGDDDIADMFDFTDRKTVKTPAVATMYGGEADPWRKKFLGLVPEGFDAPAGFYQGLAVTGQHLLTSLMPKTMELRAYLLDATLEALRVNPHLEAGLAVGGFAKESYKVKEYLYRVDGVRDFASFVTDDLALGKMSKTYFSQFVQSLDGALLRATLRHFQSLGGGLIFGNHDAYKVCADDVELLRAANKAAFMEVLSVDWVGQYVDALVSQTGITVPAFTRGDYSVEDVMSSEFLIDFEE
jgi:hypothetical protein